MTLLLTQQAQADLERSIDYYEHQRAGLGVRFRNRVKNALSYLQENPLLYPSINGVIRRQVLLDFPYSIYYYIDEENKVVLVLSIAHQYRKPPY